MSMLAQSRPRARGLFSKTQLSIVLVSVVVAGAIVLADKPVSPQQAMAAAPNSVGAEQFDMLAHLAKKIGERETVKDVRCWASCNKLLMFIAQYKLSVPAKSERMNQHAQLIQSIWDAARQKNKDAAYVSVDAVKQVLDQRYPHVDTSVGASFNLRETKHQLMLAPQQDIADYDQTIEPWRLIQNWAYGHLDANSQLLLRPQFDEEALGLVYRFLRTLDLLMLREAGRLAQQRKQSEIDVVAVADAHQFVVQPKR